MQLKSNLHWYIVYTYPNFEKKVYNSLIQKNINCFLPLQKEVRQWSDRKKTVEVPLFPNYIFVHTSNQERFNVLSVSGVLHYIMYDGSPATISEQEVMKIKKMMMDNEVMLEPYLEGDLVKIVEGPLKDVTGIVFNRKGKMRLGVKIKAINQSLSVEVDMSSIKRIEPEPCLS